MPRTPTTTRSRASAAAPRALGPGALARRLVAWYGEHARDLPWRRDAADPVTGPYRVWVSEIMLQQTQVATVVPYYARWVDAFPDLATLAAAPLDQVLGHWAGLGYYARCRNLHRAAREVVDRHGGVVPRDEAALAALPGVGPYTLGAVRSIGFGEKVPLVDGNVARVLARLDAVEGDPRAPAAWKGFWARAGELVRASADPSAFNQGLMELGATLCTPAAPACELCPLAAACRARAGRRTHDIPAPVKRPARKTVSAVCAVARRADGAVLLGRRPPSGLLGGLWEPPQVPAAQVRRGRAAGSVAHVFTHLELTLHVFELPAGAPAPRPQAGAYEALAWVDIEALRGYPLSALARKTLALVGLATR